MCEDYGGPLAPILTGENRVTPQTVSDAEYIPKDIAAQLLDLSPRRALELADERKMRTRRVLNPATHMEQTLICRADVQKEAERRRSVAAPVGWTPPPAPAQIAAPPAPQLDQPFCSISDDPFLTLTEAEVYKRLPQSFLLGLIESNRLKAFDVGKRAGGKWRVLRSHLDAVTPI